VVTPRHGKPVEVNALWYNALRLAALWGRAAGDAPGAADLDREALRVARSFADRFWDPARGRLFDVLLPGGPDARMRPNQIFAVSLPFPLLDGERQRSVVRAVQKALLTPVGLRTLAPGEPEYRPHYGGAARDRDGAYHQGVVWPWLLGHFIRAYLTAFGRTHHSVEYCRSLLRGLERHVESEGCLGSISEILEPEPPHRPVGAPAQAWSVSEILALSLSLGSAAQPVPGVGSAEGRPAQSPPAAAQPAAARF
jgi:glycogen debranching enzyme